jgi:glycolate oxidase FAD binding subunit
MEVLTPHSARELLELVQWAVAEQQPLLVEGLGTKREFGHAAGDGTCVSLRAFDGILEYEPEELVMRTGAGALFEEVAAALGARRQHLAFEPLHPDRLFAAATAGTIGGVYAGNLSGPRRFRAGAARDHILGVQAVSGRGEWFKTGGRVIKNVTGYDLGKLVAGSWGTLCIMGEITFKVLPAPATSCTLLVPGMEPDAGLALLRSLAGDPREPSGLAFLPESCMFPGGVLPQEPPPGIVAVRLEGSAVSVRERRRSIQESLRRSTAVQILDDGESRALWESIRDAHPVSAAPVVLKISLPPSLADSLPAFLPPGGSWFADAAGGWIWIGMPDAEESRAAVAAIRNYLAGNGSAVLYRAPELFKKEAGLLSAQPEALAALQERIRAGFDPARILNPGRLYPH